MTSITPSNYSEGSCCEEKTSDGGGETCLHGPAQPAPGEDGAGQAAHGVQAR